MSRILILNSWYYPNLKGGAEHSVKLLAENLSKHGFDVMVFTIDSDTRTPVIEELNGVKVFRGTGGNYNIRKAYRAKKSIWESIRNKYLEIHNCSILPELENVYKDFKPDLVHANCLAGISMSAIAFFKEKNIPIVYTLRDYYLDSPTNRTEVSSWKNPLKKIILDLYRNYTRRSSLSVAAVTAPSEFTLNYYLNNGYFKDATLKKCVVNSVDVNTEEVQKCIQEKHFHKERNYMYAGSLIEAKGIKPMLEAFMKTKLNANLFICGEGNLSEYIKGCALLDSRIKVMGKLSPKELSDVYKKSDVMLVPSLWAEPFGRVVIEAAKYGLYVIGSNNGGIPEIIKCLGCGQICNVEDEDVFAKAIESAYTKSFEQTYKNILDKISIYSIDNQINNFKNIYSEILSK